MIGLGARRDRDGSNTYLGRAALMKRKIPTVPCLESVTVHTYIHASSRVLKRQMKTDQGPPSYGCTPRAT